MLRGTAGSADRARRWQGRAVPPAWDMCHTGISSEAGRRPGCDPPDHAWEPRDRECPLYTGHSRPVIRRWHDGWTPGPRDGGLATSEVEASRKGRDPPGAGAGANAGSFAVQRGSGHGNVIRLPHHSLTQNQLDLFECQQLICNGTEDHRGEDY